jgi:hypothetical protein
MDYCFAMRHRVVGHCFVGHCVIGHDVIIGEGKMGA